MTLKNFVRIVVCIQLVLAQNLALAATPQKVYGQAVFRYIVGELATVQTAKDFDRTILKKLKPADRKEALADVSRLKKFPAVYLMGSNLIFDAGVEKLKIRWVNPLKSEININGLDYTVNPDVPLKKQVRDLYRRLHNKEHASNFLWDQFFPKAYACGGLCTIGIALAATALSTFLTAVIFPYVECQMLNVQSQKCIGEKEAREKEVYGKGPALDAVINENGTDKQNILARWEARDYVCPDSNSGKDYTYRGILRTVQIKDGKQVPLSGWFDVYAHFDKSGVPTDLAVSRPTFEGKDSKNNLIVHITFDPSTKKPLNYRFPSPSEEVNSSPLHHSDIVLTKIMKLTPKQKNDIDSADDLVRFVNYRIYNCVVQKAVADQQAGIAPGSPGQPKSTAATK